MVEDVSDADTLSRSVTLPQCEIDLATHLIKNMFPMLSLGESLIWRKYAVKDAECHDIGILLNNDKRKYKGFANCVAGVIRSDRNKNGHGFRLEHYPPQGIHHVHVHYDFNPILPTTKSERSDLRLRLNNLFGVLVAFP